MSWPPGLIEMDRKAMTSSLFPPFARELDCVLRLDLKCRRKGVIPPRSRRRQRLRLPPGAAEFLERGFVTYTPEQKCAALELDPLLIEKHGAVSAEVADARGPRRSRMLAGGHCRERHRRGPEPDERGNPVGLGI
jgi:hypothetical protein